MYNFVTESTILFFPEISWISLNIADFHLEKNEHNVGGFWIPLVMRESEAFLLKGENQISVGGIGMSYCLKGQNLLLSSYLAEAITLIKSVLMFESVHCLNPCHILGFSLKI